MPAGRVRSVNAADETLDRAERAASSLRQMIVAGEVAPGERLSESSMTERLDVSRNTLREAFRMLTLERLLTRRPNAGVFVAIPSLASGLRLAAVYALDVSKVAKAAKRDGDRPTTLGRLEYAYNMQNIARAYPLPSLELER